MFHTCPQNINYMYLQGRSPREKGDSTRASRGKVREKGLKTLTYLFSKT